MKQEQIEQILKRDDVPSDVRQILTKYFRQEQKKLIEDNRILSAVLETSPVGIALIVGNSLGWTNSTMAQLLGYEIDSINERRFQDLFPNLIEYQKVCGCLFEYSTNEEIQSVEAVLVRNDGTLIDCVFQARPIDITDIGKGVILTVTDIAERKRAEEKLQESEEKYRTILENIEEGYYEVDLEGNITFLNDSLYKSLGYSKDELMGMNNRQFMDEKTAKKVYQIFNEIYKTRKSVKAVDWEIIRKEGNKRFHEASVSVITGSKGEPIGFRGIVRDITERKKMEKALSESEERYRLLVETMSDGLAVINEENEIIYVNDRICQMSGYPRDELIGWTVIDLLEKYSDAFVFEDFGDMIEKRKEGDRTPYELRFTRKDGRTLTILISPQAIINVDGQFVGSFAVITDITEHKKAEEEHIKIKARLEYLLTSAPTIIYSCEPKENNQTTFMSTNVQTILGYRPEDFIGDPSFWQNGLHPEEREIVLATFNEFAKNNDKDFYIFVNRFKHKDGTYRWMLEEARLIRDDFSNPVEIIGSWTDITEKKQTQDALREIEKKYSDLVSNLSDTVVELNLEGIFTYVSPQGLELTGNKPEEVIGKNGFEYIHPDDVENAIEVLKKAISGEHIFNFEYRTKHKNGYYVPVSVSGKMVGEGDDRKLVTIIRDITERYQAEKELRISEKKYRDLVSNLSDVVVELDAEGKFAYVSPQVYEIFGYKSEEVLGLNGFEFIHPDDIESAAKYFEKVLDGEQIYSFEYRAKHKDGHFFPVSATGKMVGEGDDMKLVSVLRDITKQRLAEQALKESEEKYRSLVEQSLQGIIVFHEGRIIFANSQVGKMSGYSVEELLSMSPEKAAELIHPEDRLSVFNKMQNLLEGKQVTPQYEFRGIRKDGTVHWNEIFPKRIKYQGQPAIQAAYVDITERKNMEKAREELEKRRKRFIETTSHELRTPLTNVKGFIDFLQDHRESLPHSQTEEIYDTINKNIARLELLVSDVADLSKIDRDIFRLQKQKINLYDFLHKEIKTYKNLIRDQFEFRFQCEPKIMIEIDKDRIIQVLDNVVNNAIKQTPIETRKIIMNVKKHENMVRIEINDNGAGIYPEDLERIFEPFISLETEYSVKGTGIGLHLCQIIVENHNGTIKAQSEGLNQGSTFTIDLPFLFP